VSTLVRFFSYCTSFPFMRFLRRQLDAPRDGWAESSKTVMALLFPVFDTREPIPHGNSVFSNPVSTFRSDALIPGDRSTAMEEEEKPFAWALVRAMKSEPSRAEAPTARTSMDCRVILPYSCHIVDEASITYCDASLTVPRSTKTPEMATRQGTAKEHGEGAAPKLVPL
jgi:hypothetical protein